MVDVSDSEPVRLRGMAARADEPEQPIGPGVVLPPSVPVTLEFSREHVVGTAALVTVPMYVDAATPFNVTALSVNAGCVELVKAPP